MNFVSYLILGTIGLLSCGCVSLATVDMLPQAVTEVNFAAVEGKVGWSKYQEGFHFPSTSKGEVFAAAKSSLAINRFRLIQVDIRQGVVFGEHGITAFDWNVIAGIYFKARDTGYDVRVLVQGSKDYGIAGDATGANWTGNILNAMKSNLPIAPQKEDKKQVSSSGSCFVIHPEGWLITAYHVIENYSGNIQIHFGGHSAVASVVVVDKEHDLALLKVQIATPDYLSISSNFDLGLGARVYTLGYPLSGILSADVRHNDGSISSLSGLEKGEEGYFQISVPVQPGNSGGPLLTPAGDVIGVILAKASAIAVLKQTGSLPENITFAIKPSYILALCETAGLVLPTPRINPQPNVAAKAVHRISTSE